MFKRFNEWIGLKEKLHSNNPKAPLVKERDLWWISLGENIGSEINGKSKLFSRPGIILKKLSHGFYLIVPTTTQKREGTWYVNIHHNDIDMYACLHQIRTVDYRRLSTKFGQISHGELIKIKEAFNLLYK
jgi:mRNA interferase MazF